MPQVPPATLSDVKDRTQRKDLSKLLHEKEVLGYAFSYRKLCNMIQALDGDPSELQDCIVAFNKDQEDLEKDKLNTRIEAILKENKITSMRETDPFGRVKDVLYYSSTSTSFAQSRAIDKAAKYKIDPAQLKKLFEDPSVTIKTPTTIVVVKDVKETENEKSESQHA